jgi:hypothetical protein
MQNYCIPLFFLMYIHPPHKNYLRSNRARQLHGGANIKLQIHRIAVTFIFPFL